MVVSRINSGESMNFERWVDLMAGRILWVSNKLKPAVI
jgi:hypothetical protein